MSEHAQQVEVVVRRQLERDMREAVATGNYDPLTQGDVEEALDYAITILDLGSMTDEELDDVMAQIDHNLGGTKPPEKPKVDVFDSRQSRD